MINRTGKFKFVVLLMALLMLLHSCRVYHKEAVSLDQAVASKKNVLILKKDKTKEKYLRIDKIDGKYIGEVYNLKKQPVLIEEQNIEKVRLQNNGLTALTGVGIIVGSLFTLASAMVVVAFSVMADPA